MKLVLINGSPRKKKAHFIFATAVKELAGAAGHQADIFHVIDLPGGGDKFNELKDSLADADILGLFTPLYVDTLPYPVISLLETMADGCRSELRGKRLFTVSGCGFPDFRLFEPVFGTCNSFARATGMVWLGGMGYVATPLQDGRDPADMGKRGLGIIDGLRLALNAVLEGRMIPEEAQQTFAMNVPRFFKYLMPLVGNHAAKKNCKKLGTDIYTRPYL